MKSLSCHDLGDASCGFVAKGSTPEEVVKTMTAHAISLHGKTDYEMTSANGMAMLMSKVKDA